MVISYYRKCPQCGNDNSVHGRSFSRSGILLPWFHREYQCGRCSYAFKGTKIGIQPFFLLRIAWGVYIPNSEEKEASA